MRKIIGIIVFFFSFECFAQPRVSNVQEKPLRITKVSQIITNPIGWYYSQFDEKWCGYYGAICNKYKNNHKTPAYLPAIERYGRDNTGTQTPNICSLQIKKSSINDTTIYLLYVVFWCGDYRYPELEIDFYSWKATDVFVLSENEYQKLWNLETGVLTIITFNGNSGYSATLDHLGDIENFRSESCLLKELNNPKYLHTPVKKGFFDCRWFVKKEDENTIRFSAPTELKLGSEASRSDVWKWDFSVQYFEVSKNTFNKLKIQ